jgi:hypothetical protein
MRGDQVLDPFDSHRTTRAALPTAERPLFEAAMNGLRARLTAETVAAAGR